MSAERQRVRQIKVHINQLLSELRSIESDVNISPLHLTIHSQLTNLSHDDNPCPYLSAKRKSARLHSTANHEHRRKSKKPVFKSSPSKALFAPSARGTSTPKVSPQQRKSPQTSTPLHSTAFAFSPNQLIPLKRLLYNRGEHDSRPHKRRHSAVPFSKRSMLPRLHRIEENPQWI
jgi:hypothetical protein